MALYIDRNAPGSGLASLMAARGQHGDTELVHMTKPEVQRLMSTGLMSLNPKTGLPEYFLGSIFKGIKNFATKFFKPKNIAAALLGTVLTPLISAVIPTFGGGILGRLLKGGLTGAFVGGATGAVTGRPVGESIGYGAGTGTLLTGLGELARYGRKYVGPQPDDKFIEQYDDITGARKTFGGLSDFDIRKAAKGMEPEGRYRFGEKVDELYYPTSESALAQTLKQGVPKTGDTYLEELGFDPRVMRQAASIPGSFEGLGGEALDISQLGPDVRKLPEVGRFTPYENIGATTLEKLGTYIPEKGIRDITSFKDIDKDWWDKPPKTLKDVTETVTDYYSPEGRGIAGVALPALQTASVMADIDAMEEQRKAYEEAQETSDDFLPEDFVPEDLPFNFRALQPPLTQEQIVALYTQGGVSPSAIGQSGRFFTDPTEIFAKEGGLLSLQNGGAFEGQVQGNGHGMQDNVTMPINGGGIAAVSPKEYVVPADVMAMLGNGNADEGAKSMDGFISKFRKRKYGRDMQPPETDATKALQSLIIS